MKIGKTWQVTMLQKTNSLTDSGSPQFRPTKEQRDAYRAYFASHTEWLFSNYFPDHPYPWGTEKDEDSWITPTAPPTELSASEAALCTIIVDACMNTSPPLEEIAGHLDQIAWKIEKDLPMNHHDREACHRFSDQIKHWQRLHNGVLDDNSAAK